MSRIEDVTQAIGKTPLVKLNRLTKDVEAQVFVKLESSNPGGSIKDRLAFAMIEAGEKQGAITTGTTIIEPTSGNTGIGLAMICAVKGYKLIIVMPDSVSVERRTILSAYGAKVYLTPGNGGMKAAIEKANELKKELGNAFIPMQFENPSNAVFHKKTTAVEIWDDTDGKVDIFVAGAGTGGTITGVAKGLKEKNPSVKAIVVEPSSSAVISGKKAGLHKIQGIGAGFIPKVLDMKFIDEVFPVDDEKAFEYARLLALKEGILCGISTGANVYAAIELAKRPENKGKTIVTVICDTGERYLSTPLFDRDANE